MLEDLYDLAAGDVPEIDGCSSIRGSEEAAIGAELDEKELAFMADKIARFIGRSGISQRKRIGHGVGVVERRAVCRCQNEPTAIRAQLDTSEGQIPGEGSHLAAAGYIPELGGLVQTTRRQPAAIRTEGERIDR